MERPDHGPRDLWDVHFDFTSEGRYMSPIGPLFLHFSSGDHREPGLRRVTKTVGTTTISRSVNKSKRLKVEGIDIFLVGESDQHF